MLVNLIQFIGVLASMIILHEAGHFLACLIFGVPVEEFGFGFPPRITKLFEFRGTEYTPVSYTHLTLPTILLV